MGWRKSSDENNDEFTTTNFRASKISAGLRERQEKGRAKPGSKQKIWGIKRRTLNMIMETSKDSFENGHEFAAVLRAKNGVIYELLLLPDGGFRGRTSVMVYLHMLPIDLTVVGSVHSHPSNNYSPSKADLDFFGRAGSVNIIVAYPYTERSWQAYNRSGTKIDLEIVG